METWIIVGVPLVLFMGLMVLRLPIAFALGFSGFIGYWMLQGFTVALNRMGIGMYETVATFILSPVPLFIMMGEFVVISGIGADLYEAGWKWMGRIPGSLGIGSIAACAVFAAMSGVSVAGAVTIGMIAIPEMIKRGYDKGLATGLVAAGGTLSILIPPSVTFIIYGVVTQESIGKLFIAGILPGVLLSLLYASYILIKAIRDPAAAPPGVRVPMREKFRSLRTLWSTILLIVAVLGSIYLGVATVSEAAGIGALAAMFIALGYRRLSWSKLGEVSLNTAVAIGYLFIIITMAMYFGVYLTVSGVTDSFIHWLGSMPVNRWVIMLGINLLYIILGCFLDPLSILLLTLPLLHPIVVHLGFDPIWFGVVVVINMELAFLTPPLGLNLFAIRGIAPQVPFQTIVRGAFPFMLLDCLCIVIICVFPQIATWLPGLMK